MLRKTHIHTKLVSLLFAVILMLPMGVSAVEYGGVGGRPAHPREDNPRTQSIFVYSTQPGSVIEDAVLVINNSNETKTLMVYGGDYITSSSGGFACRQYAEEQREVGSWIQLEKNEVTLAPKTNEQVAFQLNIPESIAVGETNGCILIEEKKEGLEDTGDKSGVSLRFRTGLRVAITVPGEIIKDIAIESFDIEKKNDGNILLKARVRNAGNVSVDTDVQVRTNDIFGRLITQPHGGEFSILRDQSSDFNFELKKPFWGGVFASRLTVAYDPSTTTELGRESGQEKRVLRAERKIFFSPPMPLALAIEVGLILLIVFLLTNSIRRKRYAAWIENQWGRYVVQDTDTIYSLSKKYSVSWKTLARVNHLSAPYLLRPGMILRTPLIKRKRDVLMDIIEEPLKKRSKTTTKKKSIQLKKKLKNKDSK